MITLKSHPTIDRLLITIMHGAPGAIGEAKGLMLKYIPSFQWVENKWCIHVQELPLLNRYCKEYAIDMEILSSAKESWNKYKQWTRLVLSTAQQKNIATDIKLPKGELLPFQKIGAQVAYTAIINTKGYLIGDPVGLGKTPQSIAVAEYLFDTCNIQTTIVLCKSTAKYNWEGEISKFTNRACTVIEGDKANREGLWLEARHRTDSYIILNYDQLIRDQEIFDYIGMHDTLIIYDEIQMLKNRTTKRSEKSFQLSQEAKYVLGLSASFYEISIFDIFGVWNHIDPFVFGYHIGRFKYHFVIPDFWGNYAGDKKRKLSKSKIKPYFIRRRKEDVIDQTPNIRYIDHCVELHPSQYKVYKQFKSELKDSIEENPLTIFGKLLRCINSPHTLELEERITENAKITDVIEFMDDLEKTDRVVIFSHYVDPAIELDEVFTKLKIPHVSIIGQKVKARNRFEMLTDFSNNLEYRALITTDILQESHNIPTANYIVNYDIPYNPQHLVQRVGRLDRLTQKSKHIFVINIFAKNTIEEKIYRRMYSRMGDGLDIMDDNIAEKRISFKSIREML